MNTTFQPKPKRCKSQSQIKLQYQQEKSEDKRHRNKTNNEHTSKRCLCCQSKNQKYPDYLTQLRKVRVQKEKARLPTDVMISKLSVKQSYKLSKEIMQDSPIDKKVLAQYSNKVSEYQHTPGKSIFQQFHESIIKSHIKSELKNTQRKDQQHTPQKKQDQFKFTVSLQRIRTGQIFSGSYIGKHFAECIIKILEKIFQEYR